MMKFINELQMAIPICLRAALMITRLDQSSIQYTSLNLKIVTLDSTAARYLSLSREFKLQSAFRSYFSKKR